MLWVCAALHAPAAFSIDNPDAPDYVAVPEARANFTSSRSSSRPAAPGMLEDLLLVRLRACLELAHNLAHEVVDVALPGRVERGADPQ